MRVPAALFLLVLFSIAGCAEKTVTLYAPTVDRDTWMGRHRDDVVSVFGKPDMIRDDGTGGQVLAYAEYPDGRSTKPHPDSEPSGDPIADSMAAPADASHGATNPDAGFRARFHLTEDGRVYRYWFSDSAWKEGIPPPPGRSAR